jgi:hypothetical protein
MIRERIIEKINNNKLPYEGEIMVVHSIFLHQKVKVNSNLHAKSQLFPKKQPRKIKNVIE